MAHILSYLDATSLINVELVCRRWNRSASSNYFWRQIFFNQFNFGAQLDMTIQAQFPIVGSGRGKAEPQQDWKSMWRARKALNQRWQSGYAAAIYLDGHSDSVYCVQFDEYGSMDHLEDVVTNYTWLDIKSWQGRATGPSEFGMPAHMSASRSWVFPPRTLPLRFLLFPPKPPAAASDLSKRFSHLQHHRSRRLHGPHSITRDRFSVCNTMTRYWSLDPPTVLALYGISRQGIVLFVGFVAMLLVSLTSVLMRSILSLAPRTPRSVYGIKRLANFYGNWAAIVDLSTLCRWGGTLWYLPAVMVLRSYGIWLRVFASRNSPVKTEAWLAWNLARILGLSWLAGTIKSSTNLMRILVIWCASWRVTEVWFGRCTSTAPTGGLWVEAMIQASKRMTWGVGIMSWILWDGPRAGSSAPRQIIAALLQRARIAGLWLWILGLSFPESSCWQGDIASYRKRPRS